MTYRRCLLLSFSLSLSLLHTRVHSPPPSIRIPPSLPYLCWSGTHVLNAFRLIGGLPGVTISSTQDAAVAGLFADKFCGHDTSLILYIKPGSVVSRSFTSKDTHSPQGDLLVVYSDARGSYQASQLARRTALVLGFEAPSFTHGTDLMLPASVNEDLRELLGLGMDGLAEEEQNHSVTMVMGLQDMLDVDHISAVPQVSHSCGHAFVHRRKLSSIESVKHGSFPTTRLWLCTSGVVDGLPRGSASVVPCAGGCSHVEKKGES